MIPSSSRTAAPPRRHGYLYIAVLFSTLIIFSVVAMALSISTSVARTEIDRTDFEFVRHFASGEMDRLIALTHDDPDWRNGQTSSQWSSWRSGSYVTAFYGPDASVRHRWIDSDGDLVDDEIDQLTLQVQARLGNAQYAMGCEVESVPLVYDWLDHSIVAENIFFNDNLALTADSTISAEDCLWSNIFRRGARIVTPTLQRDRLWLTLYGDSEAYSDPGVPFPHGDGATLLTEYAGGTTIDPVAITVGSDLEMNNQVLSTTTNPYGTADGDGVYRINAGGKKLILRNMRFRATLVVENADQIEIREGIDWQYPLDRPDACLVTDSRVEVIDAEPTCPAIGSTGESQSQIQGLIYTSGTFHLRDTAQGQPFVIRGGLFTRNVSLGESLHIHSISDWDLDPAPGLSDDSPVQWIVGTKRRLTWTD